MAVRFIMSAAAVSQLPQHGLPEVAFTGRSNVGKSTLVGALMGKPQLVRTSRTPGRTQLLNLFVIDEALAVVDLPGYGYAKLSHTQRRSMDGMAKAYLAERDALAGVVMVMDARRAPASDSDTHMANWILGHHRPLLLAVTKGDLVPKNRQLHQLRQLEKSIGVPPGWALLCSGKSGHGLDELRVRMSDLEAVLGEDELKS